MPSRPLLLALGALLLGLPILAGCSGGGAISVEAPEEAFRRGKELYDRGKYDRAVEYFQRAFDFGRSHEWAADAQYYLAQAYFHDRQFLLSANEFTRFVELYRTDERLEEGEYLRALSYVRLSPPYPYDQTDTRTALTYLRLYLSKYPAGKYASEAGALVDELRAKLARKQFEAAELYERQDLYEAAGLTYESVLEEFPDSEYADRALLGAVRAYKAFAEASIPERQAERYQRAADAYHRLAELFPASPLLKDAEALYAGVDRALRRIETASR